MKKFLALIIAFSLAIPLLSEKVYAKTNVLYDINLSQSNSKIQKFIQYYVNDIEEYYYPDYFSGYKIDSNGNLIFLVTNDSSNIKNIIESIVGKDVVLQKVQYSFNELYSTQQKLLNNDMLNSSAIFLNTENNSIDVFCDEKTAVKLSTDKDYIYFYSKTDFNQHLESYYKNKVNIKDENEIPSEMNLKGTITINPGNLDSNASLNGNQGTVGFCALDGSGNRIIVTHGHGLSLGSKYYVGGVAVGAVDEILGTSDQLDASIIKLNSNIKISNKLYNSTVRITSTVSSYYTLLSYDGVNGSVRGYVSGEMTARLTIIYEDSKYWMYIGTGMKSGDSGAPIYIKTNSTACLLGIFKGTSGTTLNIGTPVAAIKGKREIYVYLKDTDY